MVGTLLSGALEMPTGFESSIQSNNSFQEIIHILSQLLLLLSIYQKGRHTQKAKPVQGVRLQKTNIHIPTVHYKLNYIYVCYYS